MARYSAHSTLVSLNIEDTPIAYAPPRGPAINFAVTYNQKEPEQPGTFSYSNLGPKWTFNWLSYVTDDPNNPGANAMVYVAGGGGESYSGFNSGSQSYLPDSQSHAVLVRTGSASYEKDFPDGSKQIFARTDGTTTYPRKIFMTQIVDPAGNATAIGFDSSSRVATLTDALGRVTAFSYELPGDSLKITKVTDPFGRFAVFAYTNGQLTSITDPVGIQSQFHYSSGTDFIDSLTTPYGTSTFVMGQSGTNRWIEITDPLGGKERVEYRDNAPGIAAADPLGTVPSGFTNSGLNVANSFFWDKKATQLYPPVNGVYDYTKARITHWAFNANGTPSGIPASEKAPLENRIWYSYAGQTDTNHAGSSANPNQVARVLDDGTTQLSQYQYNSIGKVTKVTDPVGRVTSYVYDTNNVDLLTIYQKNPAGVSIDPNSAAADKIGSYTYNSLHEPLMATDAAGKTTIYTYTPAHGQIVTVQNAKGETTTYAYGPVTGVPPDYLASVTSPQFNTSSAVTSFTYDSANRVRTVTNNSDNYTVTTDYDGLDRPIQVSYPDGTNRQFQYAQDFGQGLKTILDVTKTKDRRGRWTTRHYNSNRQMDSLVEPYGNSTRTTLYNWCTCGALTSVSDGRSKPTTFNRDLQSRITSKVFADNSSISYVYENTTSRLKSLTDASFSTTSYQYFADNDPKQTTYASGTPSVSFTYDPNYNRVVTMVDGIGTTNYAYYLVASTPVLGATRLQSVDGPLSNDTLTYSYDELGRTVGQSINAVGSTVAYDSLGRLATSDNALGHFGRAYVGVTQRLQTLTYPTSTGQTANFTYFDSLHDRQMQTLQNLTAGSANLSKFDYTYDADGKILTWTKQIGTNSAVVGTYGYDLADQITNAVNATLPEAQNGTPPLLGSFSYGYDLGRNRSSDERGTHIFNDVNQSTDDFLYDAVGNPSEDQKYYYSWDRANRLIVVSQKIPGVIYMAPIQGGTPTPTPKPKNNSVAGSSLAIQAAGRPTPPPQTVTYTRSEFTYDGLGRRVRILEKQDTRLPTDTSAPNFVIVSDHRYVWSSKTIAEERDSIGGTVTKRFFAEGEQIGGVNYYFCRDHLGSIREMTNSTGAVVARYEYDPYGNTARISGTSSSDFGYSGYWRHTPTGISLSLYRAYSSTSGRWLSRDPLEDAEITQGPNLYTYVSNNPLLTTDPLGLAEIDIKLKSDTLGLLDTVTESYSSQTPFRSTADIAKLVGGLLKPGDTIGKLQLDDHGQGTPDPAGALYFGSQSAIVGNKALPGTVEGLRSLQQYLGPNSEIQLFQCYSAANKNYLDSLQTVARLLGVPVTGSVGYYSPKSGYEQGSRTVKP
jgi:RHS repeat-associated protein